MKKFLSLITFSVLSLCQQNTGFAATIYTRYEIHSYEGLQALKSLEKALAIMKTKPCINPLSWYYQAAMHGVPRPDREGNLIQNELCTWFTAGTPQPSVRWLKCAAHDESVGRGDSTIHFLPWHAIYIERFEEIVRLLSGNRKFALPYWDYQKYPTLTTRFRAKSSSLYESARSRVLNLGQPFPQNIRDTIASESNALGDIVDYATFNSQINTGLHNFIHDSVGDINVSSFNRIYNQSITGGLMGNVPSAAFDPIFWVHHANIDRLWRNWVRRNPGRNITLTQLQSVHWDYLFFNSRGRFIRYLPEKTYQAINNPNYTYAEGRMLIAAARSAVNVEKLEPNNIPSGPLVEHALASVTMDAAATLKNPAQINVVIPQDKLAAVNKLPNSHKLLKLDVFYLGKQNERYEVYINLPDGVNVDSNSAKPFFAGAISFFASDTETKGLQRQFRFDITKELANSKQKLSPLSLTIIKKSTIAEGSATIKRVEVSYLAGQ